MNWAFNIVAFGMLTYFHRSSGMLQPLLHWTFNGMTQERFVKEENSSTKNQGLLLPGTEIVNDSDRVGIKFTGNRSGFIVDNVTDTCFLAPEVCEFGLSVGLQVKWPNNTTVVSNGSLISSANFSILQWKDGNLLVSLWDGTNDWQLTHIRNISLHTWACYIVSWDHNSLRFYENGELKNEVKQNHTKMRHSNGIHSQRSVHSLGDEALRGRMAIGNTATMELTDVGLNILIDDLKIWDFALKLNDTKQDCNRGSLGPSGQPGRSGHQQEATKGEEIVLAKQNPYVYVDQAYSSIEYSNKALHGFTFGSATVANLSSCIRMCMERNHECMSFNIGETSSKNEYVCQLNRVSRKNFPQNLIEKYNYYYYDVYWGS